MSWRGRKMRSSAGFPSDWNDHRRARLPACCELNQGGPHHAYAVDSTVGPAAVDWLQSIRCPQKPTLVNAPTSPIRLAQILPARVQGSARNIWVSLSRDTRVKPNERLELALREPSANDRAVAYEISTRHGSSSRVGQGGPWLRHIVASRA